MTTQTVNDRMAQNNDSRTTSEPSRQLNLRWVAEQMTILAEAFGESMTAQRLMIYAHDLVDIPVAHLTEAFDRARRECRFFPKISELRELAGAGAKDERNAEAE